MLIKPLNSAAISAKRSVPPSAQRYSIAIATFDPTEFAQSVHWLMAKDVAAPKAALPERGWPVLNLRVARLTEINFADCISCNDRGVGQPKCPM